MLTIPAGGAGHGRDIGAGILFRKSEGRNPFAGPGFRQDAGAELFRTGKADRAGAEALHGEGKIGQAVMPGQRFTRQAGGAAVNRGRATGAGCGVEKTSLAQ
ncbi:hypothetical protein D3C73_1102640 [compost metagenome]